VGERHQLDQGTHPAGMQLFEAGGMTELGRPVDRKGQLGVHRLFCPQRAVIVEYRDAIRLGDEFGRVTIGHSGDELHNRPLRGCLTPARQLIGAHLRLAGLGTLTSSPTPMRLMKFNVEELVCRELTQFE
jgi:hypothetical protein